MADRDEVAGLGRVSGLGGFLGPLQFGLGASMSCNLFLQQLGLAAALPLSAVTRVAGQHEQPGEHASDDQACHQTRRPENSNHYRAPPLAPPGMARSGGRP